MGSPHGRARVVGVVGVLTVAAVVLAFAAPLGAATDSWTSTTTTSTTTSTSTTSAPSAPAAPVVPNPGRGVHAAVTTPSITVNPATGLANGQRVTVTGRRPAQVVVQCSTDGRCDDAMSVTVPPGPDGTVFTVPLVVRRALHFGAQTIDCADAGACRVQAEVTPGALGLGDAFTYIRVDAGSTQPPAATVTPSTGLRDVQRVHVEASGFLPAATVSVDECSADGGLCQPLDVSPASVTTDGTLAADVHVLRTLRSAGPQYDCALHGCAVRLSTVDGDVATASLSFDAGVPLASPLSATVAPDADLVDGQTVTLHAAGFAPGDTVAVSQYTVPADAGEPPACASLATAAVPPAGTVVTNVVVRASVTDSFGIARPCGTARCVLEVASTHAPDDIRVAIAFGGPVAVNPSVTLSVTPASGLVDRQVVAVSGDNLFPSPSGDLPSLYECVTGVFRYACGAGGAGVVLPDGSGHYASTFRVQRVVVGADGTRYDCATAPGRCTLTLDLAHAVPLTFDPAVPPAAPPAVRLAPENPLADRTELTVHATGLVPGAYVGVSECRATTCDALDATGAVADASGSLDATLHVYRRFDDLTAGRVDCTTGCEIRADDGSGNVGIAAITFEPALGLGGSVPTVAVADAHALTGGGESVLSGTGFAPFTSVVLAECPAGAADPSPCDAFDHASADAAGAFATTTGTKAVLTTPTGPVDCRVAFATCVYAAWDGHDLFTAPIGFAAGSATGVEDPPTTRPATPPTTAPAAVDVLGEQISDATGDPATAGASDAAASDAAASGSSLPFTGGSPGTALALATAMLAAGAVLVTATRNRRQARRDPR